MSVEVEIKLLSHPACSNVYTYIPASRMANIQTPSWLNNLRYARRQMGETIGLKFNRNIEGFNNDWVLISPEKN